MKTNQSLSVLFPCLLLALAWPGVNAQAQVIINAGSFTSTGSSQNLNGTAVGVSTNLPGGNWVWGAGWNWSQPRVAPTFSNPSIDGPPNAVILGEEDTAIGLSLASSGGYTKPSLLTISAEIQFYGSVNGPAGLGFWSAMPARTDGAGVSSRDNFTGLILSQSGANDTLQIYSNGALQGSAISLGVDVTKLNFYSLSYSVNTTTGAISNVLFEGNAVLGLSSTAFTNAATGFGGVLSGTSARVAFDDFSIVSVPEPAGMALLGVGLMLVWARKRRA